MRVPWELQPALWVPWVVQSALWVHWELQPAMRGPSVVQPAVWVPWELQPALMVLRKGITLSHLKELCVRLNLATKGAKSRIQCLKAISQHQQQQHQQAPALATITPSKRHAPDSVMRMR
ncbi:hypothetical protein QJQ45_000422 [Haematococcus lacustris]|nr:hypothetical protein QJQ45_003565 [Haematococcus lacustris]KAJ9527746.1 hypothetical protein QJQ45_000422 [Haematococcus lacustris]